MKGEATNGRLYGFYGKTPVQEQAEMIVGNAKESGRCFFAD